MPKSQVSGQTTQKQGPFSGKEQKKAERTGERTQGGTPQNKDGGKKKRKRIGKKTDEETFLPGCADEFGVVPFYHRYSSGHIMIFVLPVLSAATFRGAARFL